jgi:signal transduction histidine kinase
MSTSHNELKMNVKDDGKGFDINTVQIGYGLQNMRERIEEIGGIYDIKSISSEGTRISVSLPLKDY